MEFRTLIDAADEELKSLHESGTFAELVAIERSGDAQLPVHVRPVVGDGPDGWMPLIERSVVVVNGVVAISAADLAEGAHVAAAAAAWLGDRGRSVILVDASVERPAIEKPLPEDGDEGLVDAVLFGVSPQAVVRRTLSTGVRVVTSGSHPLSVERLFEGDGFTSLLRKLAEDALVLLLVPPVHLTRISKALDGAVYVAGTAADIDSLASCVDGVRSVGVLLREPGAGMPELAGALETEPVSESAEAPAIEPVPEIEPEPESEPEPQEHDEAVPALVNVERPVEVVIPGSAHAGRSGPDRLGVTVVVAVIVVIATLLWWFIDGERRFQSRFDNSVRTVQEHAEDDAQTDVPLENAPPTVGAQEELADARGSTNDAGEPGDASATATAETGVVGEEVVEGAAVKPVVTPTETTPGEGIALRGPGGPYRIMVSSHYREASAEAEAAVLREQGIDVEVVAADVAGRGTWFRVVVSGGYPSLSGARTVLDTVRQFGYEGAWIERAPQTSSE